MTLKARYEGILDYFRSNVPVAESELNFNNAYQLLVAVMLDHQQKYVFEKLKDYLCTDQVQRVYDYRTRGIAGICEVGVSKRVVGLF